MDEKKPTILVVDDEPDLRDVLALCATTLEIEAIQAHDGLDAMIKLETHDIDVVVSDIMMPNLTGLELLSTMREQGFDQPFIVITGYGDRENVLKALRYGAYDLIDKPFKPEEVKRLIKEAVEISRNQQSLFREEKSRERSDDSDQIDAEAATRAAILRVRSLRYVDSDQEDGSSGKMTASPLTELFIEETTAQLSFCEASIRGLHQMEQRSWELGYLFRVMDGIHTAAEAVQQPKIANFTGIARDLLAFYRVEPGKLREEQIDLFSQATEALRTEILSLSDSRDEQDGTSTLLADVEEKLQKDVDLRLAGVADDAEAS